MTHDKKMKILKEKVHTFMRYKNHINYMDLIDYMFTLDWWIPCSYEYSESAYLAQKAIVTMEGVEVLPFFVDVMIDEKRDHIETILTVFTSKEELEEFIPDKKAVKVGFFSVIEIVRKFDFLAGLVVNPQEILFNLSRNAIDPIYEHMISKGVIRTEIGDIALCKTEAIVTPTNNTLEPKGEVDNQVHKIAGPELLKACQEIGECETGDAKITKGFDLNADYVIHAVGPFYSGKKEEEDLLRNCYIKSLDLAKEHNIKSISFPLISTGAKGFPLEKAIPIMMDTIKEWNRNQKGYGMTVAIVFKDEDQHKSFLEYIDNNQEEEK